MQAEQINHILSLFLGSKHSRNKVRALQKLSQRVPRFHANNVALLFRARAKSPFVLSLGLDESLMIDLYGQGIEINVHTYDGVPCVKAFFDPPFTIKAHDTLDFTRMLELWITGFKTKKGFVSALAHDRNAKFIATAAKNVAFPPESDHTVARVYGVKMEVGRDTFLVTIDVQLPETHVDFVIQLAKEMGHVKQIGSDRYELSVQIPLQDHAAACAADLHGSIQERSCQRALLNLFMLLSRPALDPVIVNALAKAGINDGAVTSVVFQARSDYGEPLAEETVDIREETENTGDILSLIRQIASTWKM